ncbi:MAG: hypothetical protein ABNH27_12340 [Alcanivorax sp.]|jgi:hypothetical protein|uniref:SDH family Clp fold serine proteinase n=1 Tax=Alcanivorax sp. TaxID=1872427 RepID=UPI0032D8E470
MRTLNSHIEIALDHYARQIEEHFNSPLFSYTGQIHPAFLVSFLENIESVVDKISEKARRNNPYGNPKRLIVVLSTPGGVAEAVEKMVDIIRNHFEEVFFVVPAAAMSAGTIFCMSGDKIYMDYASSLGPIDPQVPNPEGQLVPALGYIDKVQELIEKSSANGISQAELLMLQRLDLATLRRYEQARELSISLLKEWLIQYKFKDWVNHRTSHPGTPVTQAEKEQRAEEIATNLSDNKLWHSHGRMIGIKKLTTDLKLEIEDYTNEGDLRDNLRPYSELLTEYSENQGLPVLMHTPKLL